MPIRKLLEFLGFAFALIHCDSSSGLSRTRISAVVAFWPVLLLLPKAVKLRINHDTDFLPSLSPSSTHSAVVCHISTGTYLHQSLNKTCNSCVIVFCFCMLYYKCRGAYSSRYNKRFAPRLDFLVRDHQRLNMLSQLCLASQDCNFVCQPVGINPLANM